ncbi:hypothetical protein [Nostoc sp.]
MPRPYINAELRRLVCDRAAHLCEYCLYREGGGLSFNYIWSVSALKQINK